MANSLRVQSDPYWRIAAALALIAVPTSSAALPHVSLPFMSKSPKVDKRRSQAGHWRLDILTNRFSGALQCQLRARNHRIAYEGNALAFRFPDDWDVSKATYRVDGGPVRSFRDDLPTLLRQNTPMDGSSLDAPTDGSVWIPLDVLANANRVTIQARADRNPRTFHFRGFFGLLAIARDRGCRSEAQFVR